MATTKGKKKHLLQIHRRSKERNRSIPLQKNGKTHKDSKNERHEQKDFLKNSQKTTNKMTLVSAYLSIITSNITGSDSENDRMPEWMKKTQKSTICYLQEKSFQLCRTHTVEIEETEKDISCKG